MPTAESILGPRQVLDFAAGLHCYFVPLAETGRAQPRQRLQKNKQKHTLSGPDQERISQAHINQPDPAATSCLRELCTVDALNQALAALPQKQNGQQAHAVRTRQTTGSSAACVRQNCSTIWRQSHTCSTIGVGHHHQAKRHIRRKHTLPRVQLVSPR